MAYMPPYNQGPPPCRSGQLEHRQAAPTATAGEWFRQGGDPEDHRGSIKPASTTQQVSSQSGVPPFLILNQ